MRKLLMALKIVQKVSNEERHKQGLKRLGKGFFDAYRLNPYNPLSYVAFILMLVAGLVMYGVVGFFEKVATHNPFKWY